MEYSQDERRRANGSGDEIGGRKAAHVQTAERELTMTVEHKIVVGLGDIKAVIFECGKCHIRISVPADNIKPPFACPCGRQWMPDLAESVETPKSPYLRFFAALNQCRTLQDNGASFTILLEFEAKEFEAKS